MNNHLILHATFTYNPISMTQLIRLRKKYTYLKIMIKIIIKIILLRLGEH